MKKLLSIILLICLSEVRGQEVTFKYLIATDSILGIGNGFSCIKSIDSVVIDNDSLFNFWSSSCDWKFEKPDFNEHIILGQTYYGDCHMIIYPQVIKNDADKTYTLRTKSKYGGCRAGGSRELWIIIQKPEDQYLIKFEEVAVDW